MCGFAAGCAGPAAGCAAFAAACATFFSSQVSQATWIWSPMTRTACIGTAAVAGSASAAPVRMSKRAPWRAHSMT